MPTEWDLLYSRLLIKNRVVTEDQVEAAMGMVVSSECSGESTSLLRELVAQGLVTDRQVVKLQRALEASLAQLQEPLPAPLARGVVEVIDPPVVMPASSAVGSTPTASLTIDRSELLRAARGTGPGSVPARKVMEYIVSRLTPLVSLEPEVHEAQLSGRFGDYVVEEAVGAGGMAQVYRAAQHPTGAIVALKTIRSHRAIDPHYVQRFFAEAATTVLVDHVNVITVHGVGVAAGRPFISMEYIVGKTLRDRIRESSLGEVDGIRILRQIVEGLLAAHEQGITHRDIKPANVLLTTNQDRYGFGIEGDFETIVKLTDFGLARVFGESDLGSLDEKRFLGTAKYVAPEQALGEPPSLRSDVFALGLLAFQVFAGRDPFKGKTARDLVWQNVNSEIPLLDTIGHGLSAPLASVVAKMQAKTPSARYDPEGLLRDLARLEMRSSPGDPVAVVTDDVASAFAPAPVKPRPGLVQGLFSGLRSRGQTKRR